MGKLLSLNPAIKAVIVAILFALSYFGLHNDIHFLGYISLFGGLFIIFEGFALSLFWKILIAMAFGFTMASSGLFPRQELIAIKPVGSKLFMNGLTMALVPLVFSSILTGVTSLGDIKKLNRIGLKTIIYYVATTAIAITIGLTVANLMRPGSELQPEVRESFEQMLKVKAQDEVKKAEEKNISFFEGLVAIVPKNIVSTMANEKPDMLGIIFFAMISGLALLQIDPKLSQPVITFFTGITEMTIKIITMVMRIAPYGVFALIVSIIAETESTDLLLALLPFSICVISGLLIHGILMNSASLKFLSKTSPIQFFRNAKAVIVTAFSTSSSGATMPFTLETAEEKLGVKSEVAGFVIPLGATINMDGTALFQGASALFLANIYGMSLSLSDQLTIVFMAVAASIGTAAVPGVGIVVLTMILVSVGIPAEGILFILPVNNLLDMFRTAVNVTGDMACAVYINTSEERAKNAEEAGGPGEPPIVEPA